MGGCTRGRGYGNCFLRLSGGCIGDKTQRFLTFFSGLEFFRTCAISRLCSEQTAVSGKRATKPRPMAKGKDIKVNKFGYSTHARFAPGTNGTRRRAAAAAPPLLFMARADAHALASTCSAALG